MRGIPVEFCKGEPLNYIHEVKAKSSNWEKNRQGKPVSESDKHNLYHACILFVENDFRAAVEVNVLSNCYATGFCSYFELPLSHTLLISSLCVLVLNILLLWLLFVATEDFFAIDWICIFWLSHFFGLIAFVLVIPPL